MNKIIRLSEPAFDGKELAYVSNAIKSGWVSSGIYIDKFENSVSNFIGSKYSVACINGTSALQIALKLAGVEANTEVIVPTITFVAPVNSIIYNGASPIFMDSDKYFNLDENKTIEFILKETFMKNNKTYNKKTNKRISALLGVHVFGNALKIDRVLKLCKIRNIEIIEDASESFGTYYKKGLLNKKYSGTISKIGCLSFNGNKIISSGGGGMIITNNYSIAKKARYLINQAKDNSLKFIHNNVGYNFRISNLHAAIGLAQIQRINKILNKKKFIRNFYKNHIKNIDGFELAETPDYAENNNWLNVIQINQKKLKKNRDQIIKEFINLGIEVRPIWMLNHLQKPFKRFQNYKIKLAGKLLDKSICIPSSYNLTTLQLKKIINCLKSM